MGELEAYFACTGKCTVLKQSLSEKVIVLPEIEEENSYKEVEEEDSDSVGRVYRSSL